MKYNNTNDQYYVYVKKSTRVLYLKNKALFETWNTVNKIKVSYCETLTHV